MCSPRYGLALSYKSRIVSRRSPCANPSRSTRIPHGCVWFSSLTSHLPLTMGPLCSLSLFFFPFLVLLSFSNFDRNRSETPSSPNTNLTVLEVGLGILSGDQLLKSSGHCRGLCVLGPRSSPLPHHDGHRCLWTTVNMSWGHSHPG